MGKGNNEGKRAKEDHEIEEDGRKSKLQITLEKEGWTFLTNALIGQFGEPETNEHLEKEYKKKGYRDVLVYNSAFNIEGEPLNSPLWRAIYVKE